VRAAPFSYARPDTLEQALALLEEAGEEARVLAGGQSLMPQMTSRATRPTHLVDLNRLPGHSHVRLDGGALAVGALVRHADLEQARQLTGAWQVLREAAAQIGHHPVRVRGTIGGSMAHADPRAELPVAAAALDASFRVCSLDGERTIPAADFFVAPHTTALRPGEILCEVLFPAPPAGARGAFEEFKVRSGEFPLASAAVVLALGGDGRVTHARIALGAVGPTPLVLREVADLLTSAELSEALITEAARLAAVVLRPGGDTAYRRELVIAVVTRALRRIKEEACPTTL
jgi:CO/xanthine dehydrogenase FAD-binding subunit